MKLKALLCLLVFCGAVACADSIVLPNANATTTGTGGVNSLIRNSGNARTQQFQWAASELTAIPVGYTITGISWRFSTSISNPASWPPAGGAPWSDYEITLAEAANPISGMSTTYANNMVNPVLVQDGPLTIPEGTFTNAGPPGPNDWGYEIPITPYPYKGGDLVCMFTHPGSNLTATAPYLDRVLTSATVHGLVASSNFQGTTGAMYSSFTIARLTFIPEPASLVLLALGGLSLIRRR